jgi:hypothetical protein
MVPGTGVRQVSATGTVLTPAPAYNRRMNFVSDALTIEVSGLRKRSGSVTALDGMSFTVSPGQVTGFVAARRVSLEEAYLELTQEAVEYRATSGAA